MTILSLLILAVLVAAVSLCLSVLRRRARRRQMPEVYVYEFSDRERRGSRRATVIHRPTGSHKPPRNRYPA